MKLIVSKMADQQQPQPEEQCGVELDQDQFCCSICLDLLKQPVTINCGHSYCRGCIEDCWDKEEEKGKCSCPQCRETFNPRPALRRNNMLAEAVEKLKKRDSLHAAVACAGPADVACAGPADVACAGPADVACAGPADVACAGPADVACAGPADVACDFCSETKQNKATMSCLTCLASYCAAHLEPHYSVLVLKKHTLVSATISLQEKKNLVSSQKEVQERVQQREEEQKELSQAEENLKSCAQTAQRDCDKIFAELISSMQRRHREVKRLIRDQEKTAVAQANELQLQLENEITKLRRRGTELELLSHADDHIHFIQISQSLSASCESPDFSPGTVPLRSFRDVTDCVSELRDKLENVLRETWPKISATVSYVDFSLPPAPKSREEFLRYCCPLTLDVNSNYPYLHLISDNRRVRPSPSPYAAQPDRFIKFPQVLCRQGLSERCYWEVVWNARTLSVAVAYKDINRTSEESQFGNNDKSWSLECTANGYSFRHNNVETTVPGICSYRIGVYLDYKAGTLCFYHVSDPMVLLHKVQTTFTQPLYPGLGLNYEWYDVGVFAQLVKLW